MKTKLYLFSLIIPLILAGCTDEMLGISQQNIQQTVKPNLKGASIKYYVAKSGKDSNPGTSAAPFLTITKALSFAAAGDTVFVKAGTYQEYVSFPSSGTLDHPIVLKNYGSDVVTVDANNSRVVCVYATDESNLVIDGINVQNGTAYNMSFVGCQNVKIKNLSTKEPVVSGSTTETIYLAGSANNISRNVTIQNVTSYGGVGIIIGQIVNGINITGGEYSYSSQDGINISAIGSTGTSIPTNIVVDGAYSHNNARQGINTEGCDSITLRNCHCSYNSASGIQIEANSNNTLLEDNLCEYNCRNGSVSDYETGIWVFNSTNSIIRRNTCRNNQTGLRIRSVTNFQAYDNLIINNNYHSTTGNQNTSGVDFYISSGTFYNNTLYANAASDSKLGSIYIYPDGICNLSLKNNIIANDGSVNTPKDIGFNQPTGSTVVSDNNLVYNSNRTVYIQVKTNNLTWNDYKLAANQDAHSINANPLFLDASNNNFSLQGTSPAINAGANVGLTSDYFKNAILTPPSIGAIEYIQGQGAISPPSTLYYNAQQSGIATKNNCGTGYTGSTVTFTIPAGKYSSTTSQADADNQALTDLNNNKQAYANTNGTCTALTVYYNAQQSGTATKNNCGTGYTGSTITYTISVGKYSSTVSQSDADQQAINDVNTNKQTYANTYGTCIATTITYYNTQQSGTATKNDCGSGYTGSTVTYTVPAGKYTSTVSQTDANNLASADVNSNKQSYANTNGTCTVSTVSVSTVKKTKKWWQR